MFGNRKYSSIDFIDIFSIRHSPSEHGSALIYSNIQVFNYDKKVFQKEKLDAIKVFENK